MLKEYHQNPRNPETFSSILQENGNKKAAFGQYFPDFQEESGFSMPNFGQLHPSKLRRQGPRIPNRHRVEHQLEIEQIEPKPA